MAIYDKVADLKNTFPRLVVQYMKKYYKFYNISPLRKQNTVLIKVEPLGSNANHCQSCFKFQTMFLFLSF